MICFPCIFTSSFRWPLTSFIHLYLEVVTTLLLLVTNYHNILLVFFDPPHTSVIHLFVIHPPGIILIITECAFGFLLGPWMICSPTYYHGSVLFSKVTTYTHDFLLNFYRLCVCCLVTILYPKLCDSKDCSSPGSSVHGISQARILKSVAVSFSRVSSWLRGQTHISYVGRQILYCWAIREAP